MKLIRQVILEHDDGASVQVYEVDLCRVGPDRCVVNFRAGPRGGVLREGTLTPLSVDEAEATRVLEAQLAARIEAGYREVPETPAGAESLSGTANDLEFDDEDDLDFDAEIHEDEEDLLELEPVADVRQEARAAAVLRRIAAGKQSRSRWKLSRAVWRAGEMRLAEAEPMLINLIGSGDVMLDYCIAWSLGQCGSERSIAVLAGLESSPRSYAPVRRIARFARFELLDEADRAREIEDGLDGLPDSLSRAVRDGSVADVLAGISAALDENDPETYALLETLYLIDVAHVRDALMEMLVTVPLRPSFFQRIRHLFKAAEMRRDAAVYGLIAYRFETTTAMFTMPDWYAYANQPKPTVGPNPEKAYSSQTRSYLKKRVWRTLSRFGELESEDYVRMAAGVLAPFRDSDALAPRTTTRLDTRMVRRSRSYQWIDVQIDRFGSYWAFNQILYGNSPRYGADPRRRHFECLRPYVPGGAEPVVREESYPHLWNRHPEVVLDLLERSRCEVVHGFGVKVLRDCHAFCRELPVESLSMLLRADYEVTAGLGFELAVDRYDRNQPDLELVLAMANCRYTPARNRAWEWINERSDVFIRDSEFLVGLICAPYQDTREFVRRWLDRETLDESVASAVVGKLFAVLQSFALGDEAEARELTSFLIGTFAASLRGIGPEVIRDLLAHPLFEVQMFAGDLLLGHETLSQQPPADVLKALLNAGHPDVRVIGVRIVGQLPDDVLRNSVELLVELTRNAHPEVRAAIRSTVTRLAGADATFGRRIAEQLIAALLLPGAPEGVPSHTARVLRDDLIDHLSGVPAETVWKLLNSRSMPAQEIGGVLLATNVRSADLAPDEIVRLANHDIVAVREAAWKMCHDDVDRMRAAPEATARLLDSKWDDTRQIAFQYFREHFSEAGALPPEVLISVCDSVRPDVQQFGRQMVTRLFDDEHGEEYALKLSEHPSEAMQSFTSNFLEQHAAGKPDRLEQLMPYFLSVLSRVNRGRVARQRALLFLEQEALASEAAARVVAEIVGRVSATAAVGLKAATIELMLKIQEAYPSIAVPIDVQPVEVRGGV